MKDWSKDPSIPDANPRVDRVRPSDHEAERSSTVGIKWDASWTAAPSASESAKTPKDRKPKRERGRRRSSVDAPDKEPEAAPSPPLRTMPKGTTMRIGELLVDRGLVTVEQLDFALAEHTL